MLLCKAAPKWSSYTQYLQLSPCLKVEKGSWTLGDKDSDFNCLGILLNALIFSVNTASVSCFPTFPPCIMRSEELFLKLNGVSLTELDIRPFTTYVLMYLIDPPPGNFEDREIITCGDLGLSLVKKRLHFTECSDVEKLLFRAWMKLFSILFVEFSYLSIDCAPSFPHRCGQRQHGLPAPSQDQGDRHQRSDG